MKTSPKLRESAKRSYQELFNHLPDTEQTTSPPLPRRTRAKRTRARTQESSQGVQHSPVPDQFRQVSQPAGGMEVDPAHHQPPGQADGVDENRGEQVSLADWLDPVVPGPVPGLPPEDADGWSRIDLVGAWDCGLCQFRTLEEVPPPYRLKWTRALSTILRRVMAAQTEETLNRGLKWFLLTAQVFFREPKRGGKKGQSNGHLAARFDCLMRGDWGSLLDLWKADKEALESRQGNRRRTQRAEDPAVSAAKLRKTVLNMLARGQVGRAVRRGLHG